MENLHQFLDFNICVADATWSHKEKDEPFHMMGQALKSSLLKYLFDSLPVLLLLLALYLQQ